MQIRLTVLAPPSGQTPARACDVLVTAPAGTALAAVASGLASAVTGPEASQSGGAVVLYAGRERLDTQRCALGEPPLVDGAVLSLQVPGEDETANDAVPARLHVVAGPDAGGVHLLHGGRVRIGRSAEADVPLDDPDVSRLHCAVTVSEDGRISVADLGSTNGTSLDGAPVHDRPVRPAPGALLRLGESTLRFAPGTRTPTLTTTPDGEGHLRVARADGGATGTAPEGATGTVPAGPAGEGTRDHGPAAGAPDAGGHGGPGSHGAYGTGPFSGEDPPQVTHGRGTPLTTGEVPRRGGIGAWARRLTGSRSEPVQPAGRHPGEDPAAGPGGDPEPYPDASAPSSSVAGTWPDPAEVLLTALGPGPRLWERGAAHPEALVVRLGTAERAGLPAVPVTVGLREAGSLGLAGPRERLSGLARSVLAQLAALHSPFELEIVLISTDRTRGADERRREWSWLGWLPHLRPLHGQDCRLLLAHDREQADARAAELARRMDEGPLGPGWASADRSSVAEAARAHTGPFTVVIVDGDPGSAALRETTAGLAVAGAAAGIHLICLAETPAASPTSPVDATYDTACRVTLPFRECGAVAMLSGDVATALRLLRTAGGQVAGHGTVATVDAVSAAWAERFGRALAPLRDECSSGLTGRPVTAALPPSARLLDELGLARATPASLMARWASTAEEQPGATVRTAAPAARGPEAAASGRTLDTGPHPGAAPGTRPRVGVQRGAGEPGRAGPGSPFPGSGPTRSGSGRSSCPPAASASVPAQRRESREPASRGASYAGRPVVVLGAGPRGPLSVDLADEGPHLLIEGPAGSGRTELLRAVAASLASADRPDRLGILLIDGGGGDGLRPCTELPHVFTHLIASDPVRMREFAQALGGELKRRAELLGGLDFATWHARYHEEARALPGRRTAGTGGRHGDLDSPASSTLRLRPAAARTAGPGPSPLPRIVVLADDFDALVAPALGSPGRPSAGSVVRVLEAVARDGERLGVHLVATSARPDRTEDTELARDARLRIVLDPPVVPPSPDEASPGRGRLGHPDGRVTPFQGGRVTGRIPRTATLRPTVVPLEWERMGDPPARRPVRELGNGPTDLALLASALERAARSVDAERLPPLVPSPS
ncbi:FtsK/SpoIIIE domain-containing protein [Streptomyces sp. NBC_01754]|uniref:FtsK/SpoIIIE domain-containing protein n=1 Tax=Streptomyces sp. NBC_01754 TaxID=2975930 RepID=UPI002DD7D683|nr:FtsK/SpoIIIE domain-containing protein [Streptomyces sp. NBC_01754]WSC92761.1 FtsK/SpoIIIE domain-containing protein [Streptomyces sp. NBC_01754]